MSKNIMLLLLLCVLAGLIQNHDRMARWWHRPAAVAQKHPGGVRVVLYSTTWCGYCAQAREFLAQQQIPYRELDVENSDEGRAGYVSLGGGGIPIVVVDDRTVIRGFGPEAILTALQ